MATFLRDRQASAAHSARRVAEVGDIVASCVQCGLCNAACPTYLLQGDERDGPRGRIKLIGNMFAGKQAPGEEVRVHVGRCLSCSACVTACPVGVRYGDLVAHAKTYLRERATQSLRERMVNWFSSRIVAYPKRLRWAMNLAPLTGRVSGLLRRLRLKDLAALAEAAPRDVPPRATFVGPGTAATRRERRGRVVLLAGCAQQVLRPGINDATIRLLARSGIDVEVAPGAACCGAAPREVGDTATAREMAMANVTAWIKSIDRQETDAIIINSAGCGAEVKNYGRLLQDDIAYAEHGERIAGMARDVTEFLTTHRLGPPRRWSSLKVAYLPPCRLRHAQGVADEPAKLLHEAGFSVVHLPEADMCCGASGAYAFKEPEIAEQLRDRKVDHVQHVRPDVVATSSVVCLNHLQSAIGAPIVHVIELLDWAHGGPVPRGLEALSNSVTDVPGPPPLDVADYIRT